MFQCIIQQRNTWNRASPELKDVYPDIRLQLNEQLRCLDVRMETQVALVAELQDFFRKRAEVELDYSKNLDKLAKNLSLRHKEQKQKREQWPLFSTYSCWQQLVTQTKNLSKDHAALSEIYSTHLVSRLSQVIEDVQRIYRRCREIGYETHEEILRVLHELHTTMKTYQAYQGECRQAEAKLRLVENQRLKIEQSLPKEKLDKSKKFRLIEKEVQKRKNKYFDAKLKALKARNEYILNLEASNTTLHKYFVDDLSDLIDCMDLGFHECISRALMMHISAEEGRQASVQAGLDALQANIQSLDSRLDKQRFLEFNHTAFMIPKKFEFQGKNDEVNILRFAEPELQKLLCADMETRLVQLKSRLTSLRAESEEVWKTLETAESTLLDMLTAKDYDCRGYFGDNAVPAHKPPETVSLKLRADRHETEEFYLTKLREFMMGTSRIARLDSKHEHIRTQLVDLSTGVESPLSGTPGPGGGCKIQGGVPLPGMLHSPIAKPPRRKRIGRLQMNGQPKLFGGSLEEYLESLNLDIPLIIKSCIRVINLYGLHHQGIFRVSGSQVEINNFREAFERGEDPLADMTDASDINSVAGVLKLYLRELREPLFPIIYFEQFMELAQLESKHEFVMRMKDLVQSLPRSVVIVMRYIFAFLNHLSEYSDENMMDPYNLAICFGPTLVPVPEDKDQVQYQNQVNELIKNIILFNDEIFPGPEIGGTLYEKYISREPDDIDVGDSPSDHVQEDMDSEVYPSEDECESLEATAQFDFVARSDRELSLRKGETVTLYSQVSNDWWRGSVNSKEGLIPDKYILIKMKDEDREKLELFKSSSSEESMRRRASSSNDSVLSGASSSHSPLLGANPPWPPILPPSGPPPTTHESGREAEGAGDPATVHSLGSSRTDSCNSLDSGKDSASEEQLLRAEEDESSTISPLPSEDIMANEPKTIIKKERTKKTHWKSQSVGEVTQSEKTEKNGISDELPTFSQNRELWQRRANSQSHLNQSASTVGKDLWEMRQKHTPDLVMDLPLVGTAESPGSKSSGGESPTGPESPDMTTAAERFAKQNQCTLKKNTKGGSQSRQSSSSSQEGKEVEIKGNDAPPPLQPKPQLKAKPQLMRKPVLTGNHPSPQLVRKDNTQAN